MLRTVKGVGTLCKLYPLTPVGLYPIRYNMSEVQKTEEFDEWLSSLSDQKAQAKIVSRIERLGLGNPGDVKPVGEGTSEMRVPHGPGYRVYF